MGFKKWLGGDKPVSKFEFYIIIYTALIVCIFLLVQWDNSNQKNARLTEEQRERRHQENMEEMRKEYKLDREIREDQHKFNIRIQKEINTLKKNCKVGKK